MRLIPKITFSLLMTAAVTVCAMEENDEGKRSEGAILEIVPSGPASADLADMNSIMGKLSEQKDPRGDVSSLENADASWLELEIYDILSMCHLSPEALYARIEECMRRDEEMDVMLERPEEYVAELNNEAANTAK
ncbi:MAG: hypothetical protein V4482_03965 [Pseudomonadota bacterium]